MGYSLLISDLHLLEPEARNSELFRAFVGRWAQGAERLYILGDLFEAWIGDDDDNPFYQQVQTLLAGLSQTGCALYLIRGNRDFLLGEGFERQTGSQLLPDEYLVELYGRQVLLTHGDLLCTDDLAYHQLRSELRSPKWQQDFLAKPLSERRELAATLRRRSREETALKDDAAMDVNDEAVRKRLADTGADLLIHGHIHRASDLSIDTAEGPKRRIVLADWDQAGSYIYCDSSGFELRTFDAD